MGHQKDIVAKYKKWLTTTEAELKEAKDNDRILSLQVKIKDYKKSIVLFSKYI